MGEVIRYVGQRVGKHIRKESYMNLQLLDQLATQHPTLPMVTMQTLPPVELR
jgi:hypothetical protein